MPEINEVEIKRILNPTSIDLGEFVINPFMGCEHACLYCYVRSNRVISRRSKPWGEYVDVRVNAAELLEKELSRKKPSCVLMGSTTECFQPAERKYRISGKVLETLHKHKVQYVILTRSPYILDYLPLLKEGFCKQIYFTVNKTSPEYKMQLEPKSPAFELRRAAVNQLLAEDVPVVPYFSPLLPWVSVTKGAFADFPEARSIEFEGLNFRLGNITEIIDSIAAVEPSLRPRYEKMLQDRRFYQQVWKEWEKEIENQAKEAKKGYNIYVHAFGNYFQNRYS